MVLEGILLGISDVKLPVHVLNVERRETRRNGEIRKRTSEGRIVIRIEYIDFPVVEVGCINVIGGAVAA